MRWNEAGGTEGHAEVGEGVYDVNNEALEEGERRRSPRGEAWQSSSSQ